MSLELTKFPLTLSARLRTTFDEVLPAPLPERLAALMHRLNTDDEGEPDHGARSIKAPYRIDRRGRSSTCDNSQRRCLKTSNWKLLSVKARKLRLRLCLCGGATLP